MPWQIIAPGEHSRRAEVRQLHHSSLSNWQLASNPDVQQGAHVANNGLLARGALIVTCRVTKYETSEQGVAARGWCEDVCPGVWPWCVQLLEFERLVCTCHGS